MCYLIECDPTICTKTVRGNVLIYVNCIDYEWWEENEIRALAMMMMAAISRITFRGGSFDLFMDQGDRLLYKKSDEEERYTINRKWLTFE